MKVKVDASLTQAFNRQYCRRTTNTVAAVDAKWVIQPKMMYAIKCFSPQPDQELNAHISKGMTVDMRPRACVKATSSVRLHLYGAAML